jgi:hypothetical protein
MGIQVGPYGIQFWTIHSTQPVNQLAVKIFLNELIKLLLIEIPVPLKAKKEGYVSGIFLQVQAKTLKEGGLAALSGREYGKVTSQVNHGLDVVVVHIGNIFQRNVIRGRRVNHARFFKIAFRLIITHHYFAKGLGEGFVTRKAQGFVGISEFRDTA